MPISVTYPPDGAGSDLAARRTHQVAALAIGATTVALGLAAYHVQVQNFSPRTWAAASVAVGWSFVLAGLLAWLRQPGNRLGPLMLAAGVAYLARQLRYSEDAVLFTVFFLLGDLCFALVGHSILAYPTGRVSGRWSRRLVGVGYATVIGFPLAVLLLHGTQHSLISMGSPSDRGAFLGLQAPPFPAEGPLSHRSLLLIADHPHAVEVLQKTEVIVFYGILAALFIAVIDSRLVEATPRTRRMLAPLLLAAVALGLRAIFECVRTFSDQQPFAYPVLFWWQIAAFIALPLAMLAGMLRARLARGNVGELVVALDRAPATPQTLQQSLSRALADPSLELYFWLPERNGFVDSGGTAVSLPSAETGRAVTTLDHDGEPLAAIVHDPSLLEEPELIDAAGAAARLSLENARLHAQTRAQLQQVRESRRRIVSAADDERRRIERNLHDGAQNRLLALALELSAAQRRLGAEADPEVEQLLAGSVEELQSTVEDLRTLARGLHPTVLTEYGLAAALEALTQKSPVPVQLDVCDDRLSPRVEGTAYFVASEALSNVVKHANARHASVTARHEADRLVVEVSDDGEGGARPNGGSGLQGIADRVEALGGRLRIDSGPAGTHITAEIPCAS